MVGGWGGGQELNPRPDLKWKKNRKVSIDLYHPELKRKQADAKPPAGSVYILNFHAGFLLPEEFLKIVIMFIEDINGIHKSENKVSRVLFNSTAHLPERFPLLEKNSLLLHALTNVLKKEGIGFMIIGVENRGQDERLKGLASIADLKVTVHHSQDERLPDYYKEILKKKIKEAESNIRIISSDNVTGKDYKKKYGFLKVKTDENTILDISEPLAESALLLTPSGGKSRKKMG